MTNLPDGYVPVLDKGFAALDACMADDLSVVNSARVSFAKRIHEIGVADEGLIKFLMREKHGTPFEHNAFRFHIKAPIFVIREWQRHRIGSFNEFSGRYSEFEAEFYTPSLDFCRSQVGKPGAYRFEALGEEVAGIVQKEMNSQYSSAFTTYTKLLDMGLAKEVARDVLPVALYSQFYWTVNARSLMNFLALRNAPTALREIQEYAKEVELFFGDKMPLTWWAWIENGRVAP